MKIQQQKIFAIVFGILFLALLITYFVVIVPLLEEPEAETVAMETEAGEAIGANNRYMIFPQVERSGIQSVEVHNEFGSYTFYRDAADNFQLKGFEGMSYNQELFSSFVVSSGYPLAMMKIADHATPEEMAEYGLDNPQAYWILTTTSGTVHRVNVGDILVTEGGYYCSYEGRDTVYILSTTLASTILQPVENMISPILTAGMQQNNYFYAENFMVFKGEDLFVRLTNKAEEEKANPDAIVEVKMTYPSGYEPNTNLYYDILYNFMTLTGDSTVKVGTDDEILDQYGLLEPAYTIAYDFEDYSFYILVSEQQADGTYYATSNLYSFQLVTKVNNTLLGFLEKGLFEWISEYPFQAYITSLDTLHVRSGDGSTDVTFQLTHGKDDSGNPTLEIDSVTADGTTGHISNAFVYNFRQFYKTLLSVQLQEYVPLSEEETSELVVDDSHLLLSFSYVTLTGETVEFKFYQYSTRRVFVTINGVGEFYTYIDLMDKIINDTQKILAGMDVNSYSKK